MELYRRARGVLPSVFTFIRTVDQKKHKCLVYNLLLVLLCHRFLAINYIFFYYIEWDPISIKINEYNKIHVL